MTNNRIYGLDILRAAAIIFVLLPHSFPLLPESLNGPVQRYCPDGVGLFFVLSGYLIGQILLKQINKTPFESGDLIDFWKRRWLRTVPAYFVTIVLVIVIYWIKGDYTNLNARSLLKSLTFTQSFVRHSPLFYPESWSLCVEEWFYLSIPVILFAMFKLSVLNRKKIFEITIACIIIIVTFLRALRMQTFDPNDKLLWITNIQFATIMRLDDIMYGVLGAYLYYYNHRLWNFKNSLFVAGISIHLLLVITGFSGAPSPFAFSVQAIGTLLLLPKLVSIKRGSGLIFSLITFISVISYSLYLMNLTPFYQMILPILKKSFSEYQGMYFYHLILFIAFYMWTFGSAYLLNRFIERPFMALRDRKSKNIIKPDTSDT